MKCAWSFKVVLSFHCLKWTAQWDSVREAFSCLLIPSTPSALPSPLPAPDLALTMTNPKTSKLTHHRHLQHVHFELAHSFLPTFADKFKGCQASTASREACHNERPGNISLSVSFWLTTNHMHRLNDTVWCQLQGVLTSWVVVLGTRMTLLLLIIHYQLALLDKVSHSQGTFMLHHNFRGLCGCWFCTLVFQRTFAQINTISYDRYLLTSYILLDGTTTMSIGLLSWNGRIWFKHILIIYPI